MLSILRPQLLKTTRRFGGRWIHSCAPLLNSSVHRINTQSEVYKYSKEGPLHVKFTNEHEWLAVFGDNTAFIGITSYASEALGDATYIELPELGARYERGDLIGSVESVKSASEIYTPVTGEVIYVNKNLELKPQIINEDPMGAGWIAQIKLEDVKELEADELMSETDYESSLQDLEDSH
ncbi:glycine cleavage system H-protein subunit [Scheffersomyces spartinae]|uniref:Glycine cleavage system H protein n=1 Tax=Scheffersomyces spartinae TaxID=45513 RepID=A0A9P7VC48_9ASCO|nr:glycine cleavage system H-protein subunit [Scheffersomyces spartinae]KAG7194796.1 glycine cleavage system H-protein subunit [Scheffersomyces spartinae]